MLTPVDPEDGAAVAALLDRAFADYRRVMGHAGTAPHLAWVTTAIAEGRAHWIAERRGVTVLTRDGTTLRVDIIAIDPGQQGAGHGFAALAAIEDRARADGATEIMLHTAQALPRLVAFYSRAGYRVMSVGPHPKGRDDRLRVFLSKSLV